MMVADVLKKALELLRTDGLCRGAFKVGNSHCALGAIHEVLMNLTDKGRGFKNLWAFEASAKPLRDAVKATWGVEVATFNDRCLRFSDIEEMYEQAIKAAGQQEITNEPS